MTLTGNEILRQIELGNISINPFDKKQLNPNSYNLRLHNELKVYDRKEMPVGSILVNKDAKFEPENINTYPQNKPIRYLDSTQKNPTKSITIPSSGIILEKHQLYLARTIERTCSKLFVPVIEGRSSIGRLGLFIHVTAGYGDIGFDGCWTLEIYPTENVLILPGVEFCQIQFLKPEGEIGDLYEGKYQGSVDVMESRFYMEKNISNRSDNNICSHCNGVGKVGLPFTATPEDCWFCHGTGLVENK